jgi:hypothetical protein
MRELERTLEVWDDHDHIGSKVSRLGLPGEAIRGPRDGLESSINERLSDVVIKGRGTVE